MISHIDDQMAYVRSVAEDFRAGNVAKVVYKNLHMFLWDWIANHPEHIKVRWPGWEVLDCEVRNDCFICQAMYVFEKGVCDCKKCPAYAACMGPREEDGDCLSLLEKYNTAFDAWDFDEASDFALQIRDCLEGVWERE